MIQLRGSTWLVETVALFVIFREVALTSREILLTTVGLAVGENDLTFNSGECPQLGEWIVLLVGGSVGETVGAIVVGLLVGGASVGVDVVKFPQGSTDQ